MIINAQKVLFSLFASDWKKSIRAKYRNANFTIRTNPLMLSLKYALLKNVIKTMPHKRYNTVFIGVDGRAYFLQSIFFRTNTPMIIPMVISVKELENVDPKRRAHRAASVTWLSILVSIF